jgi:hypothetical protein
VTIGAQIGNAVLFFDPIGINQAVGRQIPAGAEIAHG